MASVYVGTYNEYNEGSLHGAWLDLSDYETYQDFLKACHEVHKGEHDPEFMIQDCEGMPDGLTVMEWMSEQEFNDIKLAMKEEEQEDEGKPAINIIDYSERAFAVVGDTKAVKDALKKMGGSFNSKLSCGAGWIFSNKKRAEVEKFIASGEVTEAVRKDRKEQTKGGEQFIAWLDEYIAKDGVETERKDYVGAVKLHDHYYLLSKPGMETRFCFHDEGPDYEHYKELTSADDKMARYFKAKNLQEFDGKIKHIEKGEEWSEDKRVWWYTSDDNSYCRYKLYLRFYDAGRDEEGTLCTDEEKKLILKGLKFARECFEKRLDAYLKRYGVSKLHTWTYWADA